VNKYLRDVTTFPTDARLAWRTDGARGLWAELAERTFFRIVRSASYNLYERDLATVKNVAPPAGVEIRMLAPSEHAMLGAVMTRRRHAQLERNLATRTVYVALRSGAVVGYSWWAPYLDTALDFSPLTLPSDAIFHGFVHVERAERHRGTASALFSAGERQFFDRGTRSCWFLVKSSNIAHARTARGRWGGRSRHIAQLSYLKTPFYSKRRLTLAESS
jgi:ribosomal protein S18 acetylase RimI-like enzyme